jgi:pimeloyl-ACP methyl ester carboxylesterase
MDDRIIGKDAFMKAITIPEVQIAMVFIGVVIGMFPGCGPQIVFANIFLMGGASAAALTANAISQDGDAGFPLIAVDRRGFF